MRIKLISRINIQNEISEMQREITIAEFKYRVAPKVD